MRTKGHLVVQDASNFFEGSLAFVSRTATVEIPSELTVEFVVPELRDCDPVPIIACRSIRKAELVLAWVEYDFDILVAAQRPR
jgi:hypothetical protein